MHFRRKCLQLRAPILCALCTKDGKAQMPLPAVNTLIETAIAVPLK